MAVGHMGVQRLGKRADLSPAALRSNSTLATASLPSTTVVFRVSNAKDTSFTSRGLY